MIQPSQNKFIENPIFISYTSLSDFIKCPRTYYLKNIYRDKNTGFRIQVASPYLSLGGVVHDSIRWFLDMKGQVNKDQFEKKFRNLWLKFRGRKGGFTDDIQEAQFGKRGLSMLDNFYKNANKLGKEVPPLNFPKYILEDNLVLMGNIDFVGEKSDGTLHILDFKTGTREEEDPLQLYIYAILAESNYQKDVTKISYWYLDKDESPKEAVLDLLDEKLKWLTEKAREIKLALEKNEWVCINPGSCRDCETYQAILDGKGEYQFTDFKFKKMIFFFPSA
ncbi:hypothetical protein A3F00_00835 [Candidatus Daviesbacteria bacterium RIFCSPHIGHO2_12_FULL_37_11]|uniref:PD-(D/E)XK endonuclease-like domain-containing protein n=1 Tax=Candidatus Daviesbacteria bacterium RIFCSPHIGHO2_12_FULL_37_11 TaxID=1797777 RepID=A0A1F5KEB1_9BACT|nr:MAG: hypothetical protein A2111_02275 [Candidatus Daviesbacteria bacterium GWA1_38_6]OGE16006.1 MAG: hypothetical protein A2769_02990 [Candidatus Daviesbacteria bacterium RIFCSPHIGHO2_01_FULL_37_27]OGE39115.1 MAG: hypothetical protein A3F00_00835 [Candidatus Daviesbacteria bacterium RIFCSPHIGHO2_12_FULL_37_11]OGE45505.1 MAG: hypothetical protein A3B39_04190 [Candidatus Daviesbacteria bacterium RIFCSPLOWO2_01_FULL_37_10]